MVRGYDQLFANRLLGALLVFAAILLITGICVWGSLYFKRMVRQDEADRKSLREGRRESTQDSINS